MACWIGQRVCSLFLSWLKSWLWTVVHQSKGKPFVPGLAQNPLLQLFCEKKYILERIHKWSQKKKKWICTFRTQLIKPGGDTFDFSNYNLRESRIYFWRNEGKILFSSCQSWIMHGAGHSIYMITFILAEKDIEAQRIWATLPGPLASKFAELVMPNLTSKLTKKLVV